MTSDVCADRGEAVDQADAQAVHRQPAGPGAAPTHLDSPGCRESYFPLYGYSTPELYTLNLLHCLLLSPSSTPSSGKIVSPAWMHPVTWRQVTEEINRKVANKVVIGVGLVLALHDILDIGESFVHPGDSASHTKVGLGSPHPPKPQQFSFIWVFLHPEELSSLGQIRRSESPPTPPADSE